MAYIAGFRFADGPFEMQMGESFAGGILLTDIDERKRAEDALKRSEAFLAEGQRLSRTGSFSWRVATGEITWSEELLSHF